MEKQEIITADEFRKKMKKPMANIKKEKSRQIKPFLFGARRFSIV